MLPERQLQISEYLYFVGFVILYFDYTVTFMTEVSNVWKRPRTALLFFCNRYFTFIANFPLVILPYYYTSPSSCAMLDLARQIVLVISEVMVCVLLALRTFALFGGDRRIVWLAAGWGVILLGASGYAVSAGKEKPDLVIACNSSLSKRDAAITSIPWIGLTLWDLTIFLLTFLKTKAGIKDGRSMGPNGIRYPIRTLMLRDGALYFGAMGAANIANIMTFYFAPPFLRGCLVSFASSISVSMMSRLMLNIYDNSRPVEEWELSNAPAVSRALPVFAITTTTHSSTTNDF